MTSKKSIFLTVNGETHQVEVEPRRLLSDVLRENLGLTGTHVGCEDGVCSACTILIDDQPARACLTYALQMEGHELTTIEAFGQETLTRLQQALQEEPGLHCGSCAPGIVMTFEPWLRNSSRRRSTQPWPASRIWRHDQ